MVGRVRFGEGSPKGEKQVFDGTAVASSGKAPLRARPLLAWSLVLGFLFSFVILNSCLAAAQTIVQNDFEDGTLQGWIPRGTTVTLTNTIALQRGGADVHDYSDAYRLGRVEYQQLGKRPRVSASATARPRRRS